MKEDALRILLTADAVGGVWQYSLDLARGLSGLGTETMLAVLGPSPSLDQLKDASAIDGMTLVDTGLPLDWLARTRTSVRTAGAKLAALADRHDVDVVQLNAPSLAAETEYRQPVVAVAHSCIGTWWAAVKGTEVDEVYRWRSELTGEGLRKADHVVAPSAAFAEATRLAHKLKKAPTTVHNGRSPLPLPAVAAQDFAFTAGRLWDKGKNVATLDRAAARMSAPLYAAGPERGPNGDAIALEHARPLGRLGEGEMARRLAAKPVFVSAAIYEPFGLAALEAANAGCPLVLADVPTFRELWDSAAVFVDPMDHEAYAAEVTRILADAELRAQLGDKARARAERYTPDAMARSMVRIYRRLVGKSGAVAAKVAA